MSRRAQAVLRIPRRLLERMLLGEAVLIGTALPRDLRVHRLELGAGGVEIIASSAEWRGLAAVESGARPVLVAVPQHPPRGGDLEPARRLPEPPALAPPLIPEPEASRGVEAPRPRAAARLASSPEAPARVKTPPPAPVVDPSWRAETLTPAPQPELSYRGPAAVRVLAAGVSGEGEDRTDQVTVGSVWFRASQTGRGGQRIQVVGLVTRPYRGSDNGHIPGRGETYCVVKFRELTHGGRLRELPRRKFLAGARLLGDEDGEAQEA